ncbi:hypothetical protein G7046_g7998 [Stylonectria norvegica]|nr:hypothetical protein G7046_g7998 [Stylonectria norvegica]
MAGRSSRTTEFEERDYYQPAPRRSAPELEEVDYRRRRTVTISPPPAPRSQDRTPNFLREEGRRTEAGPMVLRQRQVETIERHRPRSPSPNVRVREERLVRRPRSVSPSLHDDHEHEHERSRTRIVERERIREPSVVRKRSPSPRVVRYVERPRPRSPSPPQEQERERIRTRIIERERERAPSPVPTPSPPPPPPPQVIRGPIIEREVITHWRDIDHGVVHAKPPTPPPAPAPRSKSRVRERETDIDINLSRNRTEVDITRSTTRTRSKSRERRSHYHDDDLVIRREERLTVDEAPSRRRAQSAAPKPSRVDDEAEYITSRVDSKGKMGEAWGGATKDWAIVDVPPGTERVRMEGIGGGATETNWSKYSGVRRTNFIPERDGAPARAPSPAAREPSPAPPRESRLSVSVYDREREIDIEKVTDRRIARPAPPPPQPAKDMWTEITKDLVVREAIEQLGYEYEETGQFYYIMDYLRYDDVLHLVDVSDEIRRARKQRTREIEYERDYSQDWERSRDRNYGHPSRKWDEVVERELLYDSRPPRPFR